MNTNIRSLLKIGGGALFGAGAVAFLLSMYLGHPAPAGMADEGAQHIQNVLATGAAFFGALSAAYGWLKGVQNERKNK